MIYYKIQLKGTGTFLKGTPSYYSFKKDGRVFQTLGSLRTFITGAIKNNRTSQQLGNWQIVEYQLAVHAVKDIHEVIKPEKLIELLKK